MKNNKLKKLENLKLRTNTFGLKNKLGIIAIVCLLIFAGYSGVNATIKLKDPSGSASGYWGDGSVIVTSEGTSWTGVGSNIQRALDNLTGGGTVWLPDVDMTINEYIVLSDNQKLIFTGGTLKLDDLGVEQICMINVYGDNITIINPKLDEDRDNNVVNPAAGSQLTIYINGISDNLKIEGGYIINSTQGAIGGQPNNFHIEDITLRNIGEHGIYLGGATNGTVEQIHVEYLGRGGYGYGFKISNCKYVNVKDSSVLFNGSEGYSTIGIVFTDWSRCCGCQSLTVTDATYGCQIGDAEDIDISLNAINCGSFNGPCTKNRGKDIYIYDSFKDSGNLAINNFGKNAVIENFYSSAGNVYGPAGTDYNVSFTLKDSYFEGDYNYLFDVRSGHDILIENCIFNSTNISNNSPCTLESITGFLTIRDCTFTGGDLAALYLASDPSILIVEGNRFTPVAGAPHDLKTSGTNIKFIRNNIGTTKHTFFFPTVNVTTASAGFSWFNTTTNILSIKSAAVWVSKTFNITETGGANASTVDGGTITHGLSTTPTYIICTPSVAAEMVSVTSIGATTFTVAIKDHAGNAGTSQTIYWRAYL